MEFIAFPLHISAQGWLDRSASQEESILRLFSVMTATPSGGWYGSRDFGMRDALAESRNKHGARLLVIKRMNQALADLGIDWVKVENVAFEPSSDSGEMSYLVTLVFKDKGTEVYRI